MHRFEELGVPRDILALIRKPPLLKGESLDDYLDLLAGVFEDLGPRDRPEYFWAVRYTDCSWEIIRIRNMRSLIVDHWGQQGRVALVHDHVPGAVAAIDSHLSSLYPQGMNPDVIAARSMILADANKQLAYFDNAIERLQKRCDAILQIFEGRREIFLHRERERLAGRNREQPKLQTSLTDLRPTAVEGR